MLPRLFPVVDVARLDPVRRPVKREGVQKTGGHAFHEPLDGLVAEPKVEAAIRYLQLASDAVLEKDNVSLGPFVAATSLCHFSILGYLPLSTRSIRSSRGK